MLAILSDLRTQYNLFYQPSNKSLDGKWREINVVLNRPVCEIIHRQGHYATRWLL